MSEFYWHGDFTKGMMDSLLKNLSTDPLWLDLDEGKRKATLDKLREDVTYDLLQSHINKVTSAKPPKPRAKSTKTTATQVEV